MGWPYPSLIWSLVFVLAAVVLIALVALLGYALYLSYLRKKYAHIPGPPISGFFRGNMDEFKKCTEEGKSIDQIFYYWHLKYGKVVATWFYHVLFIGVADPDLIKDLVITQNLPKSPLAYEPLSTVYGERTLGGGLATQTNHQKWAKRRKIFNPAFHRSSLKDMMEDFNTSTDLFINKLIQKADGKTEVVMVEEFARATLDVISKVAFASDLDVINDENCQFTKDVGTMLAGMQQASFEAPGGFYWLNPSKWEGVKKTKDAIKSIRETGKRIIEKRQLAINRGEQVPNDILQRALAIVEEDPTADIEDLLDEFVTFFIAGHETTANKLAFCLMELCDPDHEDITKRLEQEVFEVLGDRESVHFDDLAKMHHIGETLKETLRMYPSATGTLRISQKDQVMDGLLVPAGTNLIFSSFVMGRHPDYWKNPEEFNPLRFEQEEAEKRSHYTYFPFSLGPRNCIGQHFAQIEAKVLLSRFIQTFHFKAVPGQTKEIIDRVTIRPRDGVIVTLKKRKKIE